MVTTAARIVDLLAVAFAIGATSWFFFIQSGALVKKMGRDRFVPIQMALTATLFKALSLATGLALVAALVHSPSFTSFSVISAAAGFTGAIVSDWMQHHRPPRMNVVMTVAHDVRSYPTHSVPNTTCNTLVARSSALRGARIRGRYIVPG